MTTRKGESTSPENIHEGRIVKLAGSIEAVCKGPGPLAMCSASLPAPGTERPPTSTMLRKPIMIRMIQSWKRSTTSAQVSWNKFSFSIFLKTLPLISTNWFDIRSESSAFEYELTATFSVMTW